MKKRVLAVLLAVVMLVSVLAACGGGGNSSTTSGVTSTPNSTAGSTGDTSTTSGGGEEEPSNVATGPADVSEHYDFTRYARMDYYAVKEWGADLVSQALGEKFNVTMTTTKPDADADSRFAIMLQGGDWPEAVLLEKSVYMRRLVEAGGALNLRQFFYEGNNFEANMTETSIYSNGLDGEPYGVGTWVRGGNTGFVATGGNYYWMVDPAIYKQLGSMPLNTLDDYHDYLVAAKNANLTNSEGNSVTPVYFYPNGNGYNIYWPITRSLGGINFPDNYWVEEFIDGKATIEFLTKSEKVIEGLKIANQWYREGLWTADTLSDDADTSLSKMTTGRAALLWYDFSQDNTNNFRRILRESTNNEHSWEVVGAEGPDGYDLTQYPFYPHEQGLTTYGDINGVVGWCQTCITPKAGDEALRLFDMFSFMISPEYAAWAQYGPPSTALSNQEDKDATIWDEADENWAPKLKMSYGDLTSAQSDRLGAWLWMDPINSDPVDAIKFAVNAESESKDFTSTLQTQTTLDPDNPKAGTKLLSIETDNMSDSIATESDLGVARQALQDFCQQNIPNALMAADDATFDSIIASINDYYDTGSGEEIRETYQGVVDSNVKIQGYSVLDPEVCPYTEK